MRHVGDEFSTQLVGLLELVQMLGHSLGHLPERSAEPVDLIALVGHLAPIEGHGSREAAVFELADRGEQTRKPLGHRQRHCEDHAATQFLPLDREINHPLLEGSVGESLHRKRGNMLF